MQKQLKRAFKYFIIIALINLLYLNVLVPVTLSFEQIFIIALGVEAVCYKRGIDIETISPDKDTQRCCKTSLQRKWVSFSTTAC